MSTVVQITLIICITLVILAYVGTLNNKDKDEKATNRLVAFYILFFHIAEDKESI